MTTEVEVYASIPKDIAEAIFATCEDMPKLGKTEQNTYQKYSYVSIDTYYEKLAPVARKHGLTWRVRQISCTAVDNGRLMVYEFVCDLIHKSGAFLPAWGRITIPHPIQGPQTAGSALSYAEKCFLRTMFKIATGEPDGDAVDQRTMKAGDVSEGLVEKPAKDNVVQIKPQLRDKTSEFTPVKHRMDDGMPVVANGADHSQWKLVAESLIGFLPMCKNLDQIRTYWVENTGAIDRLSVADAALYTTVKSAFTARRKELRETKEKE